MSSDGPIEPIHGIEPMQTPPARGLREKSYHLFTWFLENTLLWKRFQNSNDLNRSKKRRGTSKPDDQEAPEKTSGFDIKA
jgi:hypothetical protein